MGPKKMAATSSTTINAAPSAIFEEIADFSKWNNWSPWHKLDPNMQSTITGNPGEIGHRQAWKSENGQVGNGSQKFIEVRSNEYIKSEMHFMAEDTDAAYSEFKLEPDGDATKVTWSMDGDASFMMRGMMLIMNMEKMMTESFAKGLADLKAIAEAKPKTPTVEYEIMDMPAQWYVGKRFEGIAESAIDSTLFGATYAEIGKAIGGMEKVTGMPMSIAHMYNENTHTMDLEIAMPVAAEMKVPTGLTCAMIPAGKCAKHVFYGPYEGTAVAWGNFMGALMQEHKPRWSSYEVYANDPMTVNSPSEIETWLIQPIE
jgi:effector-binding domain-containing protein